jgi:hypothetical protein
MWLPRLAAISADKPYCSSLDGPASIKPAYVIEGPSPVTASSASNASSQRPFQ